MPTLVSDNSKVRIRPSLMGSVAYYLLPIRRKIIKSNIARVFGGQLDHKEVVRLVKAFYCHTLRFFLEIPWNDCLPRRRREACTVVENFDIMERALSQGKGVLWLTCHLGNWEVGLVNLMTKAPQLRNRVSLIRKRLRPAWLHALIMGRFKKAGIDVLEKDQFVIKKILKTLEANEVVAFVLDQHTSPSAAVVTQFFGCPAYLGRSLARIAIQTGAPVIPAITWRDDKGRHVCHFGEPIPVVQGSDREEAVQATTQAYSDVLQGYIAQRPEQWFCLAHRLWKT